MIEYLYSIQYQGFKKTQITIKNWLFFKTYYFYLIK